MFAAGKAGQRNRTVVAIRAVASTKNSGDSKTLIIPRPAGATAGDTLLVIAGGEKNSLNWAPSSVNWIELTDGDLSKPAILAAYRVLSAGDAAITDFTFSCSDATGKLGGAILAVQDGVYNASSATNNGDAGATATAVSVQSNYNQSLLLACFVNSRENTTPSTPTSMSAVSVGTDNFSPSWGVFSQYVGASETGVRLSLLSGTGVDKFETINILFKPN